MISKGAEEHTSASLVRCTLHEGGSKHSALARRERRCAQNIADHDVLTLPVSGQHFHCHAPALPCPPGPLGGEAIDGEATGPSGASATAMLTNSASSHTPGSTSTSNGSGGAPHDYLSVPCLALGPPDCVLEGEGWSLPAHKAVLQGESLAHRRQAIKYRIPVCSGTACVPV